VNSLTFPSDETISPALPTLEIEVEGYGANSQRQTLRAIIDSGSDGTALPRPVLLESGSVFRDTVRMRGVTGASQLVDRYLTKVHVAGITIRGVFAVAVSAEDDALLGRDVLNGLVVILNGPAHVAEIVME